MEQKGYVERTDVGVSLTLKLKRGSGTRDEDQIKAKVKAKTLEDACEDMNTLREYIHDSLKTFARSSLQTQTKSNSFGCCTELCNYRMYEVCGEKELKVILALDQGDTISGVARKIDENRETIRRVVNRIEEAGYVAYDNGLHLVDQTIRDVGIEFLTATVEICATVDCQKHMFSRSSRIWSMHSLPSMQSMSGPRGGDKLLAIRRTIRGALPSTSPKSTPGRSCSMDSESDCEGTPARR